jgi:hypothetical protein
MELEATRETLHRLAAHVLGRARHRVTGRFGLRASPGGFATPAFGDGPEVLRVADGVLVRETAQGASHRLVGGATLRELAAFADLTLDEAFSVGADTPVLGDVDRPLALDLAAAQVLGAWFTTGLRLLDHVCAALGAEAEPAVVQLWPEHFDLATSVTSRNGDHVNLGASPGDAFSKDPYLYVGPWGDGRPGDGVYWNAPFGAILRRGELVPDGAHGDLGGQGSFDAGLGFFRSGLELLGFGPAEPETGG